jgi:hypothetical protein
MGAHASKLTLVVFLPLFGLVAVAQDQLGTIKAAPVDCPTSGLKGTACYALESTCPGIPDYTAYVEIICPRRPQGTIIFTTGGDGNYLYEEYAYGAVAVQDVVSSRYCAVD